jgi:DNA polymerase I
MSHSACSTGTPLSEGTDERPLLLLDCMSLAFRAYFALPSDIATSAGVVTNALHGFASMLATLIKAHTPRALVVATDLPGGTFRDALTTDYKGGRDETPSDLIPQFNFIKDLCAVLAVPVIGVPTFEADDVLATMASWGRDHQVNTIVVTGDRDTFQLVEDPYVRVLYNKRGVSDYDLYDEAGIIARCGVEPLRYPLYAALRGDPSDNLPGVPGVGEKTASKLLSDYGDFDELFAHLGDLTPKLRENLAQFESRARTNQHVMTLVRDVPVGVEEVDLHMGGWDHDAVMAFFDRFEMNSMKDRFERLMNDGLLGAGGATSAARTEAVRPARRHPTPATTLARTLKKADTAVVTVSADRIAVLNQSSYASWVGGVDEFLADAGKRGYGIAGFNVKELYRRTPADGPALVPPVDDGSIMAFLRDSVGGRYDLATVAKQYLNEELATPTLFDALGDDELLARAALIDDLNAQLRERIVQWELQRVYHEIELPLVAVLGWMERRGIHVDRALLETIAAEFTTELATLEATIQDLAGHPFKVNSPQQLQKVLYDELGLKPGKKIKTGFSTDATTLEGIADQHEIVPLVLRFRELDKLRGTYGQTLIATIGPDERIHATFHQTVARTGRLSSDAPNLHNIPVRTAEGRRLRFAFGPEPGWRLLVADYNQIELRVLAHLSQDPGLLAAFAGDVDVHASIAAIVFKMPVAKVTHDQREMAKAVSYGLAYGMEAFGLSQRLGIPVADAKAVIDEYFAGFPTLRDYMDETIAVVREREYSRTEFGRIRPFPDLKTATGPQRAAAERQAMNAGIQGLAADIFKVALVRLDEALRAADLRAGLVLQVHDEVLVEAPTKEQKTVESLTRESLINAASLTVPLDVSIAWGDNWAAAKG